MNSFVSPNNTIRSSWHEESTSSDSCSSEVEFRQGPNITLELLNPFEPKLPKDFGRKAETIQEAQGANLVQSEQGFELESSYKSDLKSLEIIFGGIMPSPKIKELSKRLLTAFGTLEAVLVAPECQIMSIEGIDDASNFQIKLIHSIAKIIFKAKVMSEFVKCDSKELLEYCQVSIGFKEIEIIQVFFLDTDGHIIADEELWRGTVDHVPMYPREVIRRALELSATKLIIVHNHPSGDVTPSAPDLDLTYRMLRICDFFGIELFDHVIVGHGDYFSFKSNNLL